MNALSPEVAYVGALLALPAELAAHAADLIETDDLTDPRLQLVRAIAAELAADGIPPGPAAVLGHARRTGQVSGEQRTRLLSDALLTAYAGCPVPAAVEHYAGLVLDDALRRRCIKLAVRIRQAATQGGLTDLLSIVGEETRAVAAMRDRRARTLLSIGASPALELSA